MASKYSDIVDAIDTRLSTVLTGADQVRWGLHEWPPAVLPAAYILGSEVAGEHGALLGQYTRTITFPIVFVAASDSDANADAKLALKASMDLADSCIQALEATRTLGLSGVHDLVVTGMSAEFAPDGLAVCAIQLSVTLKRMTGV